MLLQEGMYIGRQRIRWKDVLTRDMNKLGLQEEDAMKKKRWKKFTRAGDPTTQWKVVWRHLNNMILERSSFDDLPPEMRHG